MFWNTTSRLRTMPTPLIDVSTPLDDATPTWPGSPGFAVETLLSIGAGDPANASALTLDVHTGTHVDAPCHFLPGGATTESLSLDVLTGPALVIDVPDADIVDADVLEAAEIAPGTDRLLLRTRNSTERDRRRTPFREDFVAITADAARWVVGRRIRLIGIDYCSIQRFTDPADTHLVLLEAGVVILEGLDLVNAPGGRYELLCLPIAIPGIEAAPARAVLRPLES